MTKQDKLERFAEQELKRNLHTMIVPDDNGGYVAFGNYRLIPETQGFRVYTVTSDNDTLFSNKRSALGWCVADRYNQLNLAQTIRVLDQKKQILQADIYCRRTTAERSSKQSFYETVNTKIQPKLDTYNSLNAELEKCLNSAKYLQIRGFNNETARPSGTTSRKTNS
jgi:hypothetical protein